MTPPPEPLLAEFPAHTYEQWHAAAEALLKGASFDARLVSKTPEDITIQPIYRREDIADLEHTRHMPGFDSHVRGSHASGHLGNGWEVSQELRASSPSAMNALIHEGLNGGQSELHIAVGCGHDGCCNGGVTMNSMADAATVLDGVVCDAVSIWWKSGLASVPVAAMAIAAMQEKGISPSMLRGGFENDPIGDLMAKGELRHSLSTRYDHMAALTRYAVDTAPGLRTISVRGEIHHNAGSTATQELAHVMATVVTYIDAMEARGIAPEESIPRVRLSFAVGSDYFMEIAKLRAARWLLARVANAYGVADAKPHIHAATSRWNKTSYDAHSNMLRVTSEAFAAVVAGVDSLHIGPYDEIAGADSVFSRRIARNLHTILREECGLDQVIDPAGGSAYIEWLTDQVAAKSWTLFQEIEEKGGMEECVLAGTVQQAVGSVCEAKFKDIRRRKTRIVGANMYPDLKGGRLEPVARECKAHQGPPPGFAEAIPAEGVTRGTDSSMVAKCIAAAGNGASRISLAKAIGLTDPQEAPKATPLVARRASEEYEALREASAAHAAKTGAAPAILQLNIGPSRKYRLRADWTVAFFQAAGFDVDGKRDFKSIDDAVAALKDSPADIAVITSDDATYAETVEPLAHAVKAAKPGVHLLVAGAPGDHEAAWRAAGVDDFVNVRSNNYELNKQLLQKAGVL